MGAAETEADGEPFDEKMARLTATLAEQFAEGARLEARIRANLARVGFPVPEVGPAASAEEADATQA